MKQVEVLREKLYKMMEVGSVNEILKISQELDKLILDFTQKQLFKVENDKKIS